MRIAPSARVVYANNPLAEVVCQVRFERLPLPEEALSAIVAAMAEAGYPNAYTEQPAQIAVLVSAVGGPEPRPAPPPPLHHFASSDQVWRVSVSAEFIALTCQRYVGWGDFKPRMLRSVELVSKSMAKADSVRVGLRYKDVVEREPIGLEGVPWRNLLAPFVLGPFAATGLTPDGTVAEQDISSFAFQSNIRLDDCRLLLQGGLLTSVEGSRNAFLVDSDFYLDDDAPRDCLSDLSQLDATLERLHTNAGALFRRTILETLHAALKPRHDS